GAGGVRTEARDREAGGAADQLLDGRLQAEVERVETGRLGIGVLEGAAHCLGKRVHVTHQRARVCRARPERARLEECVLLDEAPDRVLELVVAVEGEGEGGTLVEAGKGIAAGL